MVTSGFPDPAHTTIGQRIKWARERAGMSRPVLGGLVDRSAEWVKAVENGRLQAPRLPMLLRIAHALGVQDLAQLTGNGHAVPVSVFAGQRHMALTAVQAALTDYHLPSDTRPPNVAHLSVRLDQAWQVRHASSDHRTQLGLLLPDLIRDAQRAVRVIRGEERRDARRVLAGVYRLADFYCAYQPAPELVWLVADRALNEALEADDPLAIAGGTWAKVQTLRDAGRWDEALDVAAFGSREIEPYLDSGDDWRGMWGALQAEVAYVHARRGRHGQAWEAWELADRVAQELPVGYRHTQSSFSRPVMSAHATTLGVELRRPSEALRAADQFDPDAIASVPRRARHLIEVARAHDQRSEKHAVWALLHHSERTASETIKYNGFAREMLINLRSNPPTGLRQDVLELCERVGIAA